MWQLNDMVDRLTANNEEKLEDSSDTSAKNVIQDVPAIALEPKYGNSITNKTSLSQNIKSNIGEFPPSTAVGYNDSITSTCALSFGKGTGEIISGLRRVNSGRKMKARAKHRINKPDIGQPEATCTNNSTQKLEVAGGIVRQNWTSAPTVDAKHLPISSGGSFADEPNEPQPNMSDTAIISNVNGEKSEDAEPCIGVSQYKHIEKPAESSDNSLVRVRSETEISKLGILPKIRSTGKNPKVSEPETSDEFSRLTYEAQQAKTHQRNNKGQNLKSLGPSDDIVGTSEVFVSSPRETSSTQEFVLCTNMTRSNKIETSQLEYQRISNNNDNPEGSDSQVNAAHLSLAETPEIPYTTKVDTNQTNQFDCRQKPDACPVACSVNPLSAKLTLGTSKDISSMLSQAKIDIASKVNTIEEDSKPCVHKADNPETKIANYITSDRISSVVNNIKNSSKIIRDNREINQLKWLQKSVLNKQLQYNSMPSESTSIALYVSCNLIGIAQQNSTRTELKFYPSVLGLTTNGEWMLGEAGAMQVWNLSKIWDLPDYNVWKDKPVVLNGKTLEPTLEFLLSVIFRLIIHDLNNSFGENIKDVLISVPFWFSSLQRQQILDATLLADIENTKIVNENTSSAFHVFADEKISNNEKLVVISESHQILDISVYDFEQFKVPFMLASSEPVFTKNLHEMAEQNFLLCNPQRNNEISVFSELQKVWQDIKCKVPRQQIDKIHVLVSYESNWLLAVTQKFAKSICKKNVLSMRKETALKGLFCINKLNFDKLHWSSEHCLYDGTSYDIKVTTLEDKSFEGHISRTAIASFYQQYISCKLLSIPANYCVMQACNSDKSCVAGIIKMRDHISKSYDYIAKFSFSTNGIITLQRIEQRLKTGKYRPLEELDPSKYKWTPSKLPEKRMKEFMQILLTDDGVRL